MTEDVMYCAFLSATTAKFNIYYNVADVYAGGHEIYTSDAPGNWAQRGREGTFKVYSVGAIEYTYTRWQDLYLSGLLHDGTVSLSVANAKAAYDFTTALDAATDGELMIGSTGANPVLAGLTGTENRVTVTGGAGSITLSTPQDIHAAASPTFAALSLGTGELTCGSINRAADTLTLEINGVAQVSIASGAIEVTGDIDLTTVGTHEYKIGGNRALAFPVDTSNVAIGAEAGNALDTG
ncbi:unnamed protein product, partial [marine sediment metagenome]